MKRLSVFIIFVTYFFKVAQLTQVLRPRGVSLSKKVFYDASRDFTCLDGSLSIPFVYVNDDYCDCEDGSDEPGTSACPNSLFHCPNLGFTPRDILSSRVNDGICDCCDGSDEYNSTVACVDICSDLGRGAYEAAKKLEAMYNKGSLIRQDMILNAQQSIHDNTKRLEELKQQLQSVETIKNEKEALKKSIEAKEKHALDKFKAEQDKKREAQEQEEILNAQKEERQHALNAFKELDINQDSLLEFTELQKFAMFDRDGDGVVDEDEAKFFLHMKTEMDSKEFVNTGWMIMKPFYLKDTAEQTKSHEQEAKVPEFGMPETLPEPSHENEENQETDENKDSPGEEEVEGDEEAPSEDEGSHYQPSKVDEEKDAPKEPEYDEETQKLIDESKEAKKAFSEIETQYLDLTNKIREIEVLLETDFGEENEFLPLNGQCFEYDEREYTYKLCPFDRAVQIPKNGGFETNLGQWGKWIDLDEYKYQRMKYEGGATCWNGPARSVLIDLDCDVENKLVAVSEPNRCEYYFKFVTPALCKIEKIAPSLHQHTEL